MLVYACVGDFLYQDEEPKMLRAPDHEEPGDVVYRSSFEAQQVARYLLDCWVFGFGLAPVFWLVAVEVDWYQDTVELSPVDTLPSTTPTSAMTSCPFPDVDGRLLCCDQPVCQVLRRYTLSL